MALVFLQKRDPLQRLGELARRHRVHQPAHLGVERLRLVQPEPRTMQGQGYLTRVRPNLPGHRERPLGEPPHIPVIELADRADPQEQHGAGAHRGPAVNQ